MTSSRVAPRLVLLPLLLFVTFENILQEFGMLPPITVLLWGKRLNASWWLEVLYERTKVIAKKYSKTINTIVCLKCETLTITQSQHLDNIFCWWWSHPPVPLDFLPSGWRKFWEQNEWLESVSGIGPYQADVIKPGLFGNKSVTSPNLLSHQDQIYFPGGK